MVMIQNGLNSHISDITNIQFIKKMGFSSWQMCSLCLVWESWWDYDPEREIIIWLWHTGSSPQRALLWRPCKKTRYTSSSTNTDISLLLLLCLQCVSWISSSMPNCVTSHKMKELLGQCLTSCLSWSTVIRWTPGLRRWGRAETSSMHSTGAVWKTFTLSFTMGYTVTSTRLVKSSLVHFSSAQKSSVLLWRNILKLFLFGLL